MNLEQKIDKIINEYNLSSEEDGDSHRYRDVKHWRFSDFFGSANSESDPTIRRVLQEIVRAHMNECLTSSYSFVREYKIWHNKT